MTFALSVPLSFRFPILDMLSALSLLFFFVAIVIAILKYRLYEIDVVINGRVRGVGRVHHRWSTSPWSSASGTLVGNRRSPLLSAVAAAVVAVAFQPVRQAARRVANRVVYGKRATPYEVLSGFTERAAEAYSAEDVLPRMARILAEGTGADEAACGCRSVTSSGPPRRGRSTAPSAPIPLAAAGRCRVPRQRVAVPGPACR